MNAVHGDLYHIGRRALDTRVDGVALGPFARVGIARIDVAQIAPPTRYRLDIALLAREFDRLLYVVLHAGILREILFYKLGRLEAIGVQALGQTKG